MTKCIKIFALIAFIGITIPSINAQIIKTRLDIVGGGGYLDYFHVGPRYQYTDITQIGIFYGGGIGFTKNPTETITLSHMLHFGDNSFYSNRPQWYSRQGFIYRKVIKSDSEETIQLLNLGIGREIGFANWLGINIDAGAGFIIDESSTAEDFEGTDNKLIPIFRVQLFLSL